MSAVMSITHGSSATTYEVAMSVRRIADPRSSKPLFFLRQPAAQDVEEDDGVVVLFVAS
jgi:hypothetical protein